jgi:hypothetical protein
MSLSPIGVALGSHEKKPIASITDAPAKMSPLHARRVIDITSPSLMHFDESKLHCI